MRPVFRFGHVALGIKKRFFAQLVTYFLEISYFVSQRLTCLACQKRMMEVLMNKVVLIVSNNKRLLF